MNKQKFDSNGVIIITDESADGFYKSLFDLELFCQDKKISHENVSISYFEGADQVSVIIKRGKDRHGIPLTTVVSDYQNNNSVKLIKLCDVPNSFVATSTYVNDYIDDYDLRKYLKNAKFENDSTVTVMFKQVYKFVEDGQMVFLLLDDGSAKLVSINEIQAFNNKHDINGLELKYCSECLTKTPKDIEGLLEAIGPLGKVIGDFKTYSRVFYSEVRDTVLLSYRDTSGTMREVSVNKLLEIAEKDTHLHDAMHALNYPEVLEWAEKHKNVCWIKPKFLFNYKGEPVLYYKIKHSLFGKMKNNIKLKTLFKELGYKFDESKHNRNYMLKLSKGYKMFFLETIDKDGITESIKQISPIYYDSLVAQGLETYNSFCTTNALIKPIVNGNINVVVIRK